MESFCHWYALSLDSLQVGYRQPGKIRDRPGYVLGDSMVQKQEHNLLNFDHVMGKMLICDLLSVDNAQHLNELADLTCSLFSTWPSETVTNATCKPITDVWIRSIPRSYRLAHVVRLSLDELLIIFTQ